jgi:hypothetical protein
MSTLRMVCEGTGCPSKMTCILAEKPTEKHAEFSRCALWVRRGDGAEHCDMFKLSPTALEEGGE